MEFLKFIFFKNDNLESNNLKNFNKIVHILLGKDKNLSSEMLRPIKNIINSGELIKNLKPLIKEIKSYNSLRPDQNIIIGSLASFFILFFAASVLDKINDDLLNGMNQGVFDVASYIPSAIKRDASNLLIGMPPLCRLSGLFQCIFFMSFMSSEITAYSQTRKRISTAKQFEQLFTEDFVNKGEALLKKFFKTVKKLPGGEIEQLILQKSGIDFYIKQYEQKYPSQRA